MSTPNRGQARVLLMALAICGGLSLFIGDAQAQKAGAAASKPASTSKGDKAIASKKGLDSLGTKEIDHSKLPGTFEMGLAFGSVAAMIAAIKYL